MALYQRVGKSLLLSPRSASSSPIVTATSLARRARFLSTEAAATPASTTAKRKGFVEWYEGHLNARPVLTKAITGACLWGLGDVVAQVVPTLIQDEDGDGDTTKKEFKYDIPRTARAVTFGFVIHAPLSHLHFNLLEWMTVKGGFTGLSIPIFKTVMEQFVYWSWFSNSLYHGAMGAMQGKNLDEIQNRIKDVLWGTQLAQWKFWIPVQLLNFQFVPVRHQLNVVLLTSVVWTALLSAWYPPEEEAEGEVSEEKKD
ncbi:Mpv17/PMP22 family protein [Skeletonema marinoi]|uniref:Mpv17/PMP22 family protein n=1 Tax=Skeletonema marinoi TaxID=267567 RepID=A0AAD8Y7Z3_9STRA|nr:Mpv17/PMP22 family protein [Skeletonema marinoi]